MKTRLLSLMLPVLLAAAGQAATTNVAPTAAIISCAMRPGTTLMDVTYKITDPDDATVKVRALAFKDGTRSFANVIRPVTWMEGTETNIGDAITTGVNHTLTWDVRADWNIDLANAKFEVLCRDNRGLLPLNWITIPATTNTPAVTISQNVPTDAQVLDALFWLYADGDSELVLTNGNLKGTAASGMYNGEVLVSGGSLQYGAPAAVFLYRRMNFARATGKEKDVAIVARTGVSDRTALYAANRPWNESELGMDPSAITTSIVNTRWVKLTYADGAVTMSDRFTGLMWFYNAGAIGGMQQAAAHAYCENLVYAGHDDWVLPGVGPLAVMVSQKGFFTGVQNWYWADTYYGYTYVWYIVSMSSGEVNGQNNSYQNIVWPVRAGQ
jgi:hypothetical protein